MRVERHADVDGLLAAADDWLVRAEKETEGLRFCFLYADVANPTSNALYARLGFERGSEFRDWRFLPA